VDYFVLDINPEPWAVGPAGVARKNGKLIPYIGPNKQLQAYQNAIKELIGEQPKFIDGKILLRFYFWRNRAEYETPQARTHRKHEADTTNLQKATEDALQGILFKNDKDVVDIHSKMVAQGPDVRGKIVIGADKINMSERGMVSELPEWVRSELNGLDHPEVDSMFDGEDVPF